MEPNPYHLPPILSPAKGVSRTIQPTNNSFRSKESGKIHLPPLKRVGALPGIEKEKIASPRAEYDQQRVDKKRRKKKRNRHRSHEPIASEPVVEVITPSLSQSTPYAMRFIHPSSSPKVQQHHYSAIAADTEEFDPRNHVDFSHQHGDELQGENPLQIGEEPYRNCMKMQDKVINVKERNSVQKNNQADSLDNENPLAKENGPSLVNVLSTDHQSILSSPEGKEQHPKSILYKEEGYGWTEKCFQQKRRGTRIVQSKDHPHSGHPLEFHPHPPPQFRAALRKNQHAMMPHPNLPADDPRMNYSRNGRSQVRQVCNYGESMPNVTSEFQPHPPLQPRSFMSPFRQCNSLSEFSTLPLDGRASSSAQVCRNTSAFNRPLSLGPMDVHPDRYPQPRSLCKSMIGHHSSYSSAGSSPVLSDLSPHLSRDYFVHSQVYPPSSPITKTSRLKHFPAFHSNRISPTIDPNHAPDVVHNTAFPYTEPQPYFPTSVRLPANYKWAIIDDSGAVTPLPPGTFPATPKRDAQDPSENSLDSSEVSTCSFAFASSPNISAFHLPDSKHLPELQTPRAPNNSPESSSTISPLQHEQRCLGVSSKDERPQERIFEKVPSPTSVYKKERDKGAIMTDPSSCKPLTPDLEVALPRARRPVLSLTELPPSEDMEATAMEQNHPPPSPNGEKKPRNFKLPTGWFKSPFKKEKKAHRETSGMPPQNSRLPSLLTIDEFSSLNISEEKNSKSAGNGPDKDKRKRSVYTLGEFLMLCDEDDEDPDMLSFE